MIKKILPIFLLLLLAACNRFMVYKDGKAYYFASKREGLYKMLCASGDFKRVLANAKGIPQDKKDDLYKYNCVEPSAEKVQQLYVSLTVDQRKSLRKGFQSQGYAINYFPCA